MRRPLGWLVASPQQEYVKRLLLESPYLTLSGLRMLCKLTDEELDAALRWLSSYEPDVLEGRQP